jgi:hypothetical protein
MHVHSCSTEINEVCANQDLRRAFPHFAKPFFRDVVPSPLLRLSLPDL